MWPITKIILKIALVLLILMLAVAFFLFRMAICRKTFVPFRKKRKKKESPQSDAYREGAEALAASSYETYTIRSFDGLRLTSHFLPAASRNPEFILLCMHGYRSNGFKEYGIYKKFYHETLQADLWFPDQRAHGESEGKYICYGVKERFDVLSWIDYINRFAAERYGKKLPIYLHGISMGCATVLMAYGLGYPENVKGIIADCGYTSPDAIFRHIIKHSFHIPCFPVLNLSDLISKRLARFGFKDASTTDALKQSVPHEIPILFIHGKDDHFVPADMTLRNYDAFPGKKKLLLIEGASHAASYYTDTTAYEAAVRQLIYSPQSF